MDLDLEVDQPVPASQLRTTRQLAAPHDAGAGGGEAAGTRSAPRTGPRCGLLLWRGGGAPDSSDCVSHTQTPPLGRGAVLRGRAWQGAGALARRPLSLWAGLRSTRHAAHGRSMPQPCPPPAPPAAAPTPPANFLCAPQAAASCASPARVPASLWPSCSDERWPRWGGSTPAAPGNSAPRPQPSPPQRLKGRNVRRHDPQGKIAERGKVVAFWMAGVVIGMLGLSCAGTLPAALTGPALR